MSYTYQPLGGAKALFACKAPEVLLVGAAGTGKTRALLQKVHARAEKYPRSRHVLVRETRISMNETVLATYEKIVLPPGHPALRGPDRSHRSRYTYPNGAEVIVGGLDNADRLLSAEYDTAAVFEATETGLEDYEKLLTRVGRWKHTAYAQTICDCNPGPPKHWLNVRALRGGMVRIVSKHEDNPSLTPEYLEGLARLTGVRRSRYYLGEWVGSEGIVYDMFSMDRHVVTNAAPPARVLLACDDGTRNPFVCIRAHIDGDGRIHVARECYRRGLLESAKIGAIRDMAEGAEAIYVDPSAAGLKLAMVNANLPVLDANNDVIAGIARVQDRLADGTLTVDPSCVEGIQELQTYEWSANDKRDAPKKENDHFCDALRYLVAAVDTAPLWGVVSGVQSDSGGADNGEDEWP